MECTNEYEALSQEAIEVIGEVESWIATWMVAHKHEFKYREL